MTVCDAIDLQKRADDVARRLREDGDGEAANMIRELRHAFYAEWDTVQRARHMLGG